MGGEEAVAGHRLEEQCGGGAGMGKIVSGGRVSQWGMLRRRKRRTAQGQ